MPKEKFYSQETNNKDLEITWGLDQPVVRINGSVFDRSGLNRLIAVLRRARNQTYGKDE